MKHRPLLAAALMLPACAPAAPSAPLPPPVNTAGGTCDETLVQSHVGHLARTEAGPLLLRESGARVLRWIAEGSAVTMDYSDQRLNVEYAPDMKITRFTCG